MCRVKFWRFFTVSLDCDAANTVETGRFFQEQGKDLDLTTTLVQDLAPWLRELHTILSLLMFHCPG
jgi:hypothetical protein